MSTDESNSSNPSGGNNKDDIVTIHRPNNEKINENKYTKEEIKEKRMNRMVKIFIINKNKGCFLYSWYSRLYRARSIRTKRLRSRSRLVVCRSNFI